MTATELPDAATLRRVMHEVIRAEIERVLPELRSAPLYLTVRECAERYRIGYATVRQMVAERRLAALTRNTGQGRKGMLFIVAADAEAKLGHGVL